MKNEQTIAIIKDIANKHTTPAEQRAIEKAIAALQYCGNLTYYTETKRFGDKPDMREKIKEYIGELDTEIDRLESDLEKQMTYNAEACEVTETESRLNTIIEVKNDLLGRLEEVIQMTNLEKLRTGTNEEILHLMQRFAYRSLGYTYQELQTEEFLQEECYVNYKGEAIK